MSDNLVIVNDGQYLWAAPAAILATAMHRRGWKYDGWHEAIEPASEYGDPTPYTELCEDVQPVAGEGAPRDLTEDEMDSLPRMEWRPDIGPRYWTVPDAVRAVPVGVEG